MKRLMSLLAILLALTYVTLPAIPVRAETNLIANPSAEAINSQGQPDKWNASRWGNNTATLSQKPEGYTGSKSLYVNMTTHTDGDAKWMADAVEVRPNTTYTYTSFYKSNVDTEIDLQYTDAAGNVSYAFVQTVAPSADWTQLTTSFTTPENVSKVTVLHVINQIGWLQTDEISLTEKVAPPALSEGNLYANPSVETASGNAPANWTANHWGANASQFSYLSNGRTGNKSLYVNMTTHTDGDAKWMADAVPVKSNKSYTYSAYYKSNVETEVNLQYTDTEGNLTYGYVQQVPASADWAQLSFSFTTPANAAKVRVLHVLAQVGSLQTDDFSLTETVTAPPAGEDNLIVNPSMETADGNKPAKWNSNSWGTNAAQFTYENSGRTGNKSLKVTMTSHTSGDAKWFAEAVNVTPGETYLYRDYYKASVVTHIVVAFIDKNGNYSYAEQSTAPASADWAQYNATFVVPVGAVKASVYHLIDTAGTLTIDDAQLTVSTAPDNEIVIPNSSFEEGTTSPTGWQSNSWGSNTASFQYVNEGHTGNKSAKVTVSNYVNGDAKWSFTPIATLTSGKQYRFNAWYKGTVTPHVVAMYQKADGTTSYVGLPSPQNISATTWQEYADTLTVPAGVVSTSVFMFVNQNGWLQTDDYSIAEYTPNGFSQPLLTLTFDDGHEDNATNALPLLTRYGFKSTQCYATKFIQGQSQQVIRGVLDFYNAGHEICSHTVNHPFMTTLNSSDLQYELAHSKQYLENLVGVSVRNFASPYGDYNATVNDAIDNLYRSHRTVDEGFNSKDNFDIYRLRVQNILDTTPASQVKAWIEQAQADNTWLILVYHRVADNPGPYDSYINVFEEHLEAIKASGITVKTYNDALDDVTSEL